jgi:hypothetical protein
MAEADLMEASEIPGVPDHRDVQIAKLQRKVERQGQHLLGLISAADRKVHEIKKLEATLVTIYGLTDDDVVKKIIARTIPRALALHDAKKSIV